MSCLTENQNNPIHDIRFDNNTYPYGIRVSKVEYEKDIERITKVYRTTFYRMIWVCSGSVSVELDMNSISLTKDHCLFIGKNQVFKLKNYDHFDAYIIDFTEGFYARTQLDIELLQQSRLFNSEEGIVKLYLEDPYKEILVRFLSFFKGINYKDFSQLLYQLAHNTVERMLLFAEWNVQRDQNSDQIRSNSKEYSLVKKFQNLIAINYTTEKGVSFYAEQLNTSSRSLASACTITNKPSPKRMIIDRVLIEAKRLLKFTDLSIKEITYRLGYDEYNSFIKLFTSNIGMSPMNFREKYQ
ncbi:helix-turn-helix domain-containing protein [Mesonia aquimarina]|uniref:helix-turn-helix domain-containing protein n=1 Tax=Mesonia aquimarina TaxID=1504967 RepID=UPI000EF60EA2|nr:helix-turn-helix domain-containing protein [Mesonia aquimarina]